MAYTFDRVPYEGTLYEIRIDNKQKLGYVRMHVEFGQDPWFEVIANKAPDVLREHRFKSMHNAATGLHLWRLSFARRRRKKLTDGQRRNKALEIMPLGPNYWGNQ